MFFGRFNGVDNSVYLFIAMFFSNYLESKGLCLHKMCDCIEELKVYAEVCF